jgi:hypothetical protein
MAVPVQLKQWANEVKAVKRANPSLSHKEAMQVASGMRRKAGKPKAKPKPKGKRGGNFLDTLGSVASIGSMFL